MRSRILPIVAVLLAPAACASQKAPPVQAGEASVAGHETAAAKEERAAEQLAGHFDSRAEADVVRCGGPQPEDSLEPCWASATNPTEYERDQARAHLRRAAEHRAASKVLRDAEARACAGVRERDRDTSPFLHRGAITRVDRIYGADAVGLEGVIVVFRPVRGLTAAWLQGVVDCHVARNAALGNDVPELAACPLVPKGVTAHVEEVGDGLAVTIRTPDGAAAAEVVRRAELLRPL